MINVLDARELKKAGIPQDEALEAALHRTAAAIADCARKGWDKVNCTVTNLSDVSFEKLCLDLQERGFAIGGFRVISEPSGGKEASRCLTISWE